MAKSILESSASTTSKSLNLAPQGLKSHLISDANVASAPISTRAEPPPIPTPPGRSDRGTRAEGTGEVWGPRAPESVELRVEPHSEPRVEPREEPPRPRSPTLPPRALAVAVRSGARRCQLAWVWSGSRYSAGLGAPAASGS